MADRPLVTADDFNRLLTEVVGSKSGKPQGWFADRGLDEEIEELLIESAQKGTGALLFQALIVDGDSPEDAMGNIAATMILSGFCLGWEACKQFGGGDD